MDNNNQFGGPQFDDERTVLVSEQQMPPQYGGQPQYGEQVQYGGQPQYGEQAQYGGQPQYGAQPQFVEPQMSLNPGPKKPSKKSHTGLIVGIIIAVAAIVAAVVVWLMVKPKKVAGGYDSDKEVVEEFWRAFAECNKEDMGKCFPDIREQYDTILNQNYRQAESVHDYTEIDVNNIKFSDGSGDEDEVLAEDKQITKVSFYKLAVPMTQKIDDITYEVMDYYDVTVVKLKNKKWYIWEMHETGVDIVGTDEPATEAPTEEPTEEPTEAPTEAPTTEASVTPPAGDFAGDLASLQVSIDGVTYAFPIAYSDMADKYTFDMADYGYEDGYELEANHYTAATVDLEGDFDSSFYFYAGFINADSVAKDIKECDLRALSCEMTWCKTDNYPSVVLPGGITWGSTYDEVVAAYGEPTHDPYRSDDLGYWSLEWDVDVTDNPLFRSAGYRVVVYDDGGVKKIEINCY